MSSMASLAAASDASAAATAAATSAAAIWDAGVTASGVTNDATDSRAFLAIITALAASLVVTVYYIRAFVRLRISRFRVDDHLVTAASVMSGVQFAVTFIAIHRGFGESSSLVDDSNLILMLKVKSSSFFFSQERVANTIRPHMLATSST